MEVTERLAEKLEIDAEDGIAVVNVVEDGPADDRRHRGRRHHRIHR